MCSPTAILTRLHLIPSLLLTAAVHHHFGEEKTRTKVGLVVEAGDVREVHHVATLVGFGAAAVNPYLAMESVEDLAFATAAMCRSPRGRGQQLGQVAGQGRAQGDVEDGVSRLPPTLAPRYLRPRVYLRSSSTSTSPAPRQSSVGLTLMSLPRKQPNATPSPIQLTASSRTPHPPDGWGIPVAS
ncbi:MAG: glutamate synthase central domain-containing protein [Nocardioidaceae bacterium]